MPLYDWIHSNLHDLNLDWIIKKIKNVETAEANSAASAADANAAKTAAAGSATAANNSKVAAAGSATAAAASAQTAQNLVDQLDTTIAADVADWLNTHVTPTSPIVDDTLTIQGAAADAKKTGDEITELKANIHNLSDGNIFLEKTLNWQNGWVNTSGQVAQSQASQFAVVPLKAGQTVIAGTRNTNIAIISTTTSDSVSIGDNVTPVRRTSATDQYEEYSYTASEDINVVICVRTSIYNVNFLENTELLELAKSPFVHSYEMPEVADAFLDFVIYLAEPIADVRLKQVLRGYGSTPVHAVVLTVNGVTVNVLNVLTSAYTEKSYNTFTVGELSGYFVIDWTKVDPSVNYNNLNVKFSQSNIVPPVETPKYSNVKIILPDTINVAVGQEISLEYYNIIRCNNVNEYQITWSTNSAEMQNLGDRLRIVPVSAGTINNTINVYKNEVLITSKRITINKIAYNIPSIKALFIGDSMTNAGYFLAELVSMMGASLTLYGTRETTVNDASGVSRTVKHEGRTGWSTANYINDSSYNGATNVFYNGGFDFAYYMAQNTSFNDVTDVFILLGTNDGSGAGFETRYETICNSIKAYNSNIKIHCMLPIPPIKSGYAWGVRNYTNVLTFKNDKLKKDAEIMSIAEGQTGYTIIPTHANIDCWYDFPKTAVQVNSRNPETMEVGNDNVHPLRYGYYRMADVILGDIIAND